MGEAIVSSVLPVRRVRKTDEAIELLTGVIENLKRDRHRSAPAPSGSWRSGDLEIDTERWVVRLEGQPVHLARKEFLLLRVLVEANGAPVPRKALWSRSMDDTPNSSRSLDAHIWSLRRKIEKDPANPKHIVTVFRHGYRLE